MLHKIGDYLFVKKKLLRRQKEVFPNKHQNITFYQELYSRISKKKKKSVLNFLEKSNCDISESQSKKKKMYLFLRENYKLLRWSLKWDHGITWGSWAQDQM